MKHSIRHITAALVLACAVSGCGASNEDIGEIVRESMKEFFASDPDYGSCGLIVTEVVVIHVENKQYKGLATVWYRGQSRQIVITIVFDGEYAFWEVEMDSFFFLEDW